MLPKLRLAVGFLERQISGILIIKRTYSCWVTRIPVQKDKGHV